MIPAILMPAIDPVIVQIGPLAIRWYALAYVAGLLPGWYFARKLVENDRLWSPTQARPTAVQLDDLLVYAALGVVVGGRWGTCWSTGCPTTGRTRWRSRRSGAAAWPSMAGSWA